MKMKKKNILLFSHNLDLGGAPFFLLNLSKGYLAKQFNIYVISPIDGPLKKKFKHANIKVNILNFHNRLFVNQVIKYIKQNKIDLILFNTILMHGLILDLKEMKIPFIWAIHESEIDYYLKVLQFQKESFSRCEKILFASNETKDLYLDYLKNDDHSIIIPNGIDFDGIQLFRRQYSEDTIRKKYKHDKDHIIISVIATVSERKGQVDFVNAAIYLLKSGLVDIEKTFFYIIGYKDIYQYGHEIRHLISMYGYMNNIRLVGETNDIFDYYYLSDIIICTSYIESFPLVILEAMAFEKAILSSNVYGIKEQIKDNKDGLLFTPGVFVEITNGLLRLIKDDTLRKNLGANAFLKAKNQYQITVIQKKYEELFLRLLTI